MPCRSRIVALSRDSRGPTFRRRLFMHAGRQTCMNERRREMETYVFANQKGGVGKTTVSLGIAAAMAERGSRALLIDLDPQASATKVVGIDVEEQCTMADALLEPERYSLVDTVVRTEWGFDLAPSEMALASRESRRSTADEFVLRNQLENVTGYDVTLVDCPPSLGVLTLNALAAASHLVLVTEPSFLALQGIDELLQTRDLVRAHYNSRLALAGVVVNRVERTVEHRAGLAEIATFFGANLVWSPHLPKRTALQEGARRGVPMSGLATHAARELRTSFGELADRIEVRGAV
ncbi:MAG: ParA family protein [Acidimicrobiia bacterium]